MRALVLLLLLASCAVAGITERLRGLGFTGISTIRQVPREVCGPIVEKAVLTGNEWKDNSIGDRLGRIDSTFVMYLGDVLPVTGVAFADFEGTTYVAFEAGKLLFLLSGVPRGEYRGRFFLVIMSPCRLTKYIIE